MKELCAHKLPSSRESPSFSEETQPSVPTSANKASLECSSTFLHNKVKTEQIAEHNIPKKKTEKIHLFLPLRCPETLFISHENANFLFSVFWMVQSEAKTPKIMGVAGQILHFTCPEDWHFPWKMNIRMSVKTSPFVRLALYFLINSKLAFSVHVSQRCQAGTAKKFWIRVANSAKNNFLPFCLETCLAWKFLFLCSFLNNYPWTFEKFFFQKAIGIKSGAKTKK